MIPRLSDGKKVIFAFIEDAEKGPTLIVGENIAVGSLLDLTAQARIAFEAQWRAAIETKLFAEKKPATLVGLNGEKIASQ